MNVDGVPRRTIAPAPDGDGVEVLDQTVLPHRFSILRLHTLSDAADAISRMVVRGAPLIGVTAAYGLWLGLRQDPSDAGLAHASRTLSATRPTAVNLRWALRDLEARLAPIEPSRRARAALSRANEMAEEDVAVNRAIGRHGLSLLRHVYEKGGKKGPVHVLTHCNAGWLATVDVGTALAPVYAAFDEGLPVHVYADETRPRGQGARLTAWELSKHGVPVTVVADTAAGHLLQRGRVDLCIVGTDRVAANGDVANKIGTYLVALAARDAGVPFHVALPGSTIDGAIEDGVAGIPIEERSAREVTHVAGRDAAGHSSEVEVTPAGASALNPAFDVTPARLVTSFITERGICPASRGTRRPLSREVHARGEGGNRSVLVKHAALRKEIVETARRLESTGLNRGTSGNVSVRAGRGCLVTPSGVPCDEMAPVDVVEMTLDGKILSPVSKTAPEPSTEWPFHAAIYAARPDAEAIVHAHSEAAMAVACLRRDVPAFHYMVAVAGGTSLRCARYATFGTAALARAAVEALEGRRACLLANHGQVALHQSLRKALTLAVEVESLCATYLRALSAGTPITLSETQMAEVTSKFSTYGLRSGHGTKSRKRRSRTR